MRGIKLSLTLILVGNIKLYEETILYNFFVNPIH